MSSLPAPIPHAEATPEKRAPTPVAGVQAAVPVEAAANDEQPEAGFAVYGDPLIGMAVASVILLAVLAALMASA